MTKANEKDEDYSKITSGHSNVALGSCMVKKWISVKEMLPDFKITVLAIRLPENNCEMCYLERPMNGEKSFWYIIRSGVFYPTHWMPLPEPPIEEPSK